MSRLERAIHRKELTVRFLACPEATPPEPRRSLAMVWQLNPSLHIRALHQIVRIYQGRAGICPCGVQGKAGWLWRRERENKWRRSCHSGLEKVAKFAEHNGPAMHAKGVKASFSNCRADTVFGLWNANTDSKEAFSYTKWEQITWKWWFKKKKELKPPETPYKC